MKYHGAVKFLAVLLAALALLGAVGSAFGIIGLLSAGLYENSPEDMAEMSRQSDLDFLAEALLVRYGALEVGDMPEEIFAQIWYHYVPTWIESYVYTIYAPEGDQVYSTFDDEPYSEAYYLGISEISYPVVLDITQEIRDDPIEYDPDDIRVFTFESYDDEIGDWVFAQVTVGYETLSGYAVQLYVISASTPETFLLEQLTLVWNFRYQLPYLLAVSLLLFAACMVYLFCAAGRKPGREEILPGGLNAMPLDLYAAILSIGGAGLIYLGIVGAEYLANNAQELFDPWILGVGYGCTLLVVGFLFACAAQFKTRGGYWWRRSLVGRCCLLAIRLCRWAFRLCRRILAWCRQFCTQKLLPGGKRFILGLWNWFKSFFSRLWNWCKRVFIRCGRGIARFYCLLPLTWQWLLTALTLLLFVFLGLTTYDGFWMLLFAGAFLGLTLYGASAFGILLEGVKRMNGGDLEAKISSQFLIGAFREFAQGLNGLADVAVVAAQKQMKSERMKTELITNVSHDIKTPLTSIINYVDLLQNAETPEEQAAYLEVLSRQSQHMKKLIEDLIEMSKASTGNISADIIPLNAAESINQALGEFADKLTQAHLTPVFRQPEQPVYMRADGRLTWRVMSNLLNNAVKYAMPGTRLYIDLMALEGKVVISMKNVSRESLNVSADELLERFVRGDASRNTEGSGLGLNIAKSLMEIQKGQLQLLVDGDLFKVTLVFPGE